MKLMKKTIEAYMEDREHEGNEDDQVNQEVNIEEVVNVESSQDAYPLEPIMNSSQQENDRPLREEDSQPEEGIEMVTKEVNRGNPSEEPSIGDVELPLKDVEAETTLERPRQT